MAVGVPENEVFAAADALLARGERPTVERAADQLSFLPPPQYMEENSAYKPLATCW